MNLSVKIEGDRELLAALDRLGERELRSRVMRALRAGAKEYRSAVRERARSAPRRLRKTRTKSGPGLRVRVSPASPLANIWEAGGARPHQIGAPGQYLTNRGWRARWGEAPFAAVGPVRHPGFRARPIWRPAFEAETPTVQEVITIMLTEAIHGTQSRGR